jgi:hypothetical protein
MTESVQIVIVVVMLVIGVVFTLRRRKQFQQITCSVCRGAWNVDLTCPSCHEMLHQECWDRHLCKYRVN